MTVRFLSGFVLVAACAPSVNSKPGDGELRAVDSGDADDGGSEGADGSGTAGDDAGSDDGSGSGDTSGADDGGTEDGGSSGNEGGDDDAGGSDTSGGSGEGETGGDDTTGDDSGDGTDDCTVVVPADATVYTRNSSSSEPGEWALVCGSGTVSFSGDGVSVAVLNGAGAVVGGAGSEVWLEGSADLATLGDQALVHATESSRVVDDGTNTTLDICDVVVIDTSAVSLDGC